MKIGFGGSGLKDGHSARGVGTYTRNLINGLLKIKGVEIIDEDKLEQADLVHYTSFDLFKNTLSLNGKPTVLTIHDVTPLVFPKHYPPGLKGRLSFFLQKRSLRKINHFITDSVASKRDIAKYLNIKLSDISVVYLGVSEGFQVIKDKSSLDKIKEKYKLPERFALYVGDVNWNKNLLGIAEATAGQGLDVVFVGKAFERRVDLEHVELKDYREFLNKWKANSLVHLLGFVEDKDLIKIYNLATVTLLPSFYEGFGLPILESQACGTPVITSSVSSMPEVIGEGGLLIDPNSPSELKEAVLKVFTDEKLRENLVKKGLNNFQKFSWERTIKKTVEIYQQALKQSEKIPAQGGKLHKKVFGK